MRGSKKYPWHPRCPSWPTASAQGNARGSCSGSGPSRPSPYIVAGQLRSSCRSIVHLHVAYYAPERCRVVAAGCQDGTVRVAVATDLDEGEAPRTVWPTMQQPMRIAGAHRDVHAVAAPCCCRRARPMGVLHGQL